MTREAVPGPSRHTVIAAQSSRVAYRTLFARSVRWRTYVQSLPETLPEAPAFVEDLFYALYDSEVELNPGVAPHLYRHFALIAALLSLAEFTRLRRETAGNPIEAALVARRLADDLLANFADDTERMNTTSGSALATAWSWAFRRRRTSSLRKDGQQSVRSRADGPVSAAEAEAQPEHTMLRSVAAVVEESARDRELRNVWGIEPGVRSAHALDDVWALIDSVRALPGFEQLTTAFLEMTELLRPASRGRSRRRRRIDSERFEKLHGLTRGRDVERVVPEEFVRLLDTDMAGLFHEAYEHGRLLQERYGGRSRGTPGPLIVCLDTSRSMNTIAARGWERFVWAKGVGLALLGIARRTERSFLGICFSSEENVDTFEMAAGRYDPQLAIDLARCDFDGGTHFQAPLLTAVRRLEQHHRDGADRGPGHIVFVTDGEAALPEAFVERFGRDRRRLGFQLMTIFIDGEQPELVNLSDRVFVVRGDRLQSWHEAASGLVRALASG